MKVIAVETLQLAEFPFLFWLRVHTDAGIIGTGETFWAPGPVASYIHDNVAPYLLGKDPRSIELHDRTLGSVYVGARDSGAEVRGNSAVNIALWDIYGQALGEPLWRLLGGRTHQSVPIYNTCAGYTHVRATKKNALFERAEDWSLKLGDSNRVREGQTRFGHALSRSLILLARSPKKTPEAPRLTMPRPPIT